MASHEFRTPLSAILASVSLIKSYTKEADEEKRNKHIERIKASVKNLTSILNDYLSLEKLEQGKVEVLTEPFDLLEFTEDIVEEVNALLKPGQHIKLSFNAEREIVQDKKILRNVLLNLLSNAIKYSGESTTISLLIDTSDKTISIKIKDQGIGIPEKDQEKLFNKFYRAGNVSNIQGTGLGLHIVKRYMELLSGTISFVSEANRGTTFTIQFPQNKRSKVQIFDIVTE